MLCELTIENVAVIEKATTSFGGGLNVLTGETGAGKSILIDSINAILGNRTSREIVRSGADKAKIWATFGDIPQKLLQKLDEAGYPSEDELLLYREISSEGKSNCRINGMPATAAMLRDVCGGLINIHGQHDNQSLLNPAKHMEILDAFAQNEMLRDKYTEQYSALMRVQKEINRLDMDENEKARRIELLRYETDEIDKAELVENEEEELLEKRSAIRNAQDILNAINAAYIALTGGDEETGAATLLGEAAGQIEQITEYAPDLSSFSDTLNEMYYNAGEIASELQNRLVSYDFEGISIDDLEHRLDLIYRLRQKYGSTVKAVLEYGEKARQELESIELSTEQLSQLEEKKEALLAKITKTAALLTQSRRKAFEALSGQLAQALAFLNMPGITMALQYTETKFTPAGRDNMELYISTNAGETPKPLAKIASGGELARIMLALKSALASRDDVPTVIYDEIDTGISGMAAGRIGKMLRDTAGGRQVICVTHTAQVAAHASHHLLIQKQVEEGRTYTSIAELDEDARINELARIISGDNITDIARANAQEMVQAALAE